MKTKLEHLIRMANERKRFAAIHPVTRFMWFTKDFLETTSWDSRSILADWEYEEIRDPEVVEFECEFAELSSHGLICPHAINLSKILRPMIGKKWKITAVEVVE